MSWKDGLPPEIQRLMSQMDDIQSGIEEHVRWSEHGDGSVDGTSHAPVAGGLVSLRAEIRQKSGGYSCYIVADCLPLRQDATKEAATIAEAKTLVLDTWRSQVVAMGMIRERT